MNASQAARKRDEGGCLFAFEAVASLDMLRMSGCRFCSSSERNESSVSSEYVLSSEGRKDGTSRYDCLAVGCAGSLEGVDDFFQLDGEATTVLSLEDGVSGLRPFWKEALLIDMVQYTPSQSGVMTEL